MNQEGGMKGKRGDLPGKQTENIKIQSRSQLTN
jgi:hypothetical protein